MIISRMIENPKFPSPRRVMEFELMELHKDQGVPRSFPSPRGVMEFELNALKIKHRSIEFPSPRRVMEFERMIH